jgi:ribosomal protein L11 methyltransferase
MSLHHSLRIEFSEENYSLIRSTIEELKIDCFEEGETITTEDGDLELIKEYSLITLRFSDEEKLEFAKNKLQITDSSIKITVTKDNPNFLDEWKKFAVPIDITESTTIYPSWVKNTQIDPNRKTIMLDAGYAFGSGSHETTILCAREIEELVSSQKISSILDIGCGSGILSFIAHINQISKIHGIDIDEEAIISANNNAIKNSFDAIEFSNTPLSKITTQYDLVVANIISSVLFELKKDILRCIKPGGFLILSGILENEFEDVVKEFNLENAKKTTLGEWGLIISSL